MRTHTANELRDRADILAPDGVTVLAECVSCGITDLSGHVREQAQLIAPQTSHMILFRAGDASLITASGYLNSGNILFVVDYCTDPRQPRSGMWLEVFCHAERTNS